MLYTNEILKYLGFFTIGSISITGLITYVFNKIFEHKLAKISLEHQIRFSRIYNDQADQWRATYKDLVVAERDLELLLRPVTFNPSKSRKEVEDNAVKSIKNLFDNFDENKILFESQTIETIEILRKKFINCWGKHFQIEFLRDYKESDEFSKAVSEAHEIYETVIQIEIPKLKEYLRKDLRKLLRIGK
jgi:hypothetical protein